MYLSFVVSFISQLYQFFIVVKNFPKVGGWWLIPILDVNIVLQGCPTFGGIGWDSPLPPVKGLSPHQGLSPQKNFSPPMDTFVPTLTKIFCALRAQYTSMCSLFLLTSDLAGFVGNILNFFVNLPKYKLGLSWAKLSSNWN